MRKNVLFLTRGREMSLPFSVEQFMSIFEKYNIAVWPMQIASEIT